jgi:hypothetical protein
VPLAQQELLEAPPRRRLIVPAGHVAHWGVDPSSQRIALAGVLRVPDGSLARWVRSVPFVAGEGGQRLSGVYAETRRFVEACAVAAPWPGVVWVEQPSGRMTIHALEYAVGVIQAAVFDALEAVTGSLVRVETVPSASWKLAACGRGNLYKPTKAKLGRSPVFEDYGVARWARTVGYEGWSYDEADALGVAEAARREVALEQR